MIIYLVVLDSSTFLLSYLYLGRKLRNAAYAHLKGIDTVKVEMSLPRYILSCERRHESTQIRAQPPQGRLNVVAANLK